ncbi:MAG TPA: hypothetical protein VI815_01465, partial [Candidatus Nanoarchaeia archaeon]|nr:hypothetical protein [Candidatus Nanoarchaeia archaeon]
MFKSLIRSKHNAKIASFVFTVAIISMLLVAGPANAFNLKLDLDKVEVVQGEDLSFEVTAELGDY